MTGYSGQETVDRLGRKDLNLDGSIINLAVVGSSRFYNFEVFERIMQDWVEKNGYPDLIVVGGASGVDYMAERWADANIVPIAVFAEGRDPVVGPEKLGPLCCWRSLAPHYLHLET